MSIILKKTLVAALITIGMASTAQAADGGHGKITFKGSILDAACSISQTSDEQTVQLGQVSKAALQNGGKSNPTNFSINLENCMIDGDNAKNKVQVTFTGKESTADNGLLGISGSASGASVAITDAAGALIKLGSPTKPQELQNGKATLNFAAYLQGNGGTSAVTEGDFTTVADFTLAYN
ncbi:TPA: type 1 fimbrial protein [Enterobacter kobei]|nr:type 1 fimbrial protein [Enterobacter kobei]HCM9166471.1 type 1 fimbrial protein [Enterobacter kobei]HEP0934959.1 type 1 fimbrial protein [Enterobacter roggenkampii]